MKLIKGRKIADEMLTDLKKKIKKSRVKPGLAVILVGNDKASRIYVNLKRKEARKIGVNFYLYKFDKNVSEIEIISRVKELNRDEKVYGILVQLPLPKKFNPQKIINSIDPKKDADGFSAQGGPASGGHSQKTIDPVFPKAIITMLKSIPKKYYLGKRSLILANSREFGEVMKKALGDEKIKADVIFALGGLASKLKKADIIISAVGKPKLIKGDMLKKGSIIIDGGITKKGKKVLGDADFDSIKNVVSYVTPVPGGVGPVTVATLMENVYKLAKESKNRD